jgi:hypothetical protein
VAGGRGRPSWSVPRETEVSSAPAKKREIIQKKKKKWRSEDFRINGLSEEFGIWMAQMSEPGLPDGLFSNQKFKFG